MKKYQITPEHQIELEKIKEKYIANALRTDAMTAFDKRQMLIAMRGLYKNANLPYPGDHKIIFVQSPLIAQVASGIAMHLIYGNRAARNAENAAENAAVNAARNAENAAVNAAENAARNAAENESSLDIFINAFVNLGKKYGKFALFSISLSWRYRTRSALWPWYQVYGDFFKNVAKLPGEWEKWEPLNLDALRGGVRFMTPDFTIISDRPEILKLGELDRLHCENGPAVKWRDGMERYYWKGVSIPDRWITNKKSLTPKEVLNTTNVEQRRAGCEILGWHNVLEHPSLNPRIIDKDEDEMIGTLIEVDLPDAPKQWFLKYKCPTGRYFAEVINDKKFNTAKKANARGFGYTPESGLPPELYIATIAS